MYGVPTPKSLLGVMVYVVAAVMPFTGVPVMPPVAALRDKPVGRGGQTLKAEGEFVHPKK